MKVILKKDVLKVGKKDEIIEVSDGYAKNFLLKKGLADVANNSNLNVLQKKLDEKEALQKIEYEKNLELKKEIENITLKFKLQIHNKQVSGSVSLVQIAKMLHDKYKITIDKRKFVEHKNLKDIGLNYLKINLYKNVEATLKVQIDRVENG